MAVENSSAALDTTAAPDHGRVPRKRVSMRKTREILRLRHERKLSQRQIAAAVNLSQTAVLSCLKRFESSGLKWPLNEETTEEALDAALYKQKPRPRAERRQPDFGLIDEELRTHRHTTRRLLWEEYRQSEPKGYSYSRFCALYEDWKASRDVVLRQDHKAGEKLFVDWAGAKIPVCDRHSGAVHEASLFVAVLGASSYTYAEATWRETSEDWTGAHVRAFSYIKGVPEIVVPDNLKAGVLKPCRYDPELNPAYREMAEHYGVGVVPARVRKPRDKAKAEAGVQVVQRWIVAALRHRRFFSLAEINEAIGELLDKLNHRPFRHRKGSRWSLFLELDLAALRPLPATPFEPAVWKKAKVNIDYHIEFDGSFYSVPHRLVRQPVEVRATASTVEIFHRDERVASHQRTRRAGEAVTVNEHRPKSHQAHLEWTPSRIVAWAARTGPNTAALVERILESKPHPEMGYRSCLGLLRLGERYTAERLEKAAGRALLSGACSYKSVKSILSHSLDTQSGTADEEQRSGVLHGNVRGSEYFA
jgi:transposase